MQFLYQLRQKEKVFLNEDGSVLKENTVDYGTVIELPENPVKQATAQYTYAFSKWNGYTAGMTVTEDVTFAPEFTATVNKYTYKFLNEDESVFYENTVDYGAEITAPDEVPTKAVPYTFDKWEGFTAGMQITEDISFKATFKFMDFEIAMYNSENILAETKIVTFDDDYTLVPATKTDYDFIGYYTEKDGNGIKLTDEKGNSLKKYAFEENISAYPYFISVYNNKFIIGENAAETGTKNVILPATFATLKDAKYLTFTLKYSESIIFNKVISRDFEIVTNDEPVSKDGYTYLTVTAKYLVTETSMPVNKQVKPLEISFNIPEDVTAQTIEIFVENVSLLGDAEFKFEEITNGKVVVKPKLAETITIVGEETIETSSEYTANVFPEYTAVKDVIWTVDDETVATITENGVLTPLKTGTVTVTAKAKDGSNVYGTKTVNVIAYATIDSLVSNIGKWNREFNPDIREYTIYVQEETNTISLTADFEGLLQVNNSSLMLPRTAKTLRISEEETVIELNRTAVEGRTDITYTITIIKVPSKAEITVKNGNNDTMIELVLPVEMLEKETVYISVKTQNNRNHQVNITGKTINNDTNKVTLNIPQGEDVEKYVVFFWESLGNLKPVYAPIEKEL